jgi:hypothetical protein
VYCEENGAIYLVPVGDVGVRGHLRLERTRNAQSKKVRWAEPYRLGKSSTNAVGLNPAHGVSLGSLLPS